MTRWLTTEGTDICSGVTEEVHDGGWRGQKPVVMVFVFKSSNCVDGFNEFCVTDELNLNRSYEK